MIRKSSLVRKFMILCAAILLVILLAMAFQVYMARRVILDRSTGALTAAHQQTYSSLEYFSKTVGNAAFALCYSPTIQQLLKTDSDISRVLMNDDVNSVFSSTSLLQDNIIGISVFDKNGDIIASNGQTVIKEHIGIGDAASHPDGLVSSLSSQAEEQRLGRKTYTISYPIYTLQTNRLLGPLLGAVMFTMNTENVQDILSSIESYEDGMSMLEDSGSRLVASSSAAAQVLYDSGEWRNKNAYLSISSKLSGSNWTLVSLIPKGQLQRDLLPILWMSYFTGAAIFLLLAWATFLLYRKVLTPIRELSGFMQSVPALESNARYQMKNSGDELGLMAQSMNTMLDSMDEKNAALRKSETQYLEANIARQEMEILAYRNQISPHFLYNTLECMRGIALYRNAPEIVRISQSLSQMFRYTVKGGNFATVADEVRHTKEYATIIGYRFMDRIKIDFTTEEDAMDCLALRLTLQPLVENAVFHGLEKNVGEGIIRVEACIRRERLYLTVSDNGVGMPPGQLEALRKSLLVDPDVTPGSEKGIGLVNIARRLKLFYHGESTLHLESRPNGGTRVQISIPAKKEADPACTQSSSPMTNLGSHTESPT